MERRAALPGAPVQLEARRTVSAGLTVVLVVCVCVCETKCDEYYRIILQRHTLFIAVLVIFASIRV